MCCIAWFARRSGLPMAKRRPIRIKKPTNRVLEVPAMFTERPNIPQWYRGVPLSARTHTIAGLALLVSSIGCFGVWAGLAPLNGAVVASGSFVATGQNKLVQHLEGGIIRELLVNEGDLVEPNQVLVRNDDTPAKSKLRRLVLKKYRLLAMKARLEAEMSSSETIDT